jgi:hypothetical protein
MEIEDLPVTDIVDILLILLLVYAAHTFNFACHSSPYIATPPYLATHLATHLPTWPPISLLGNPSIY